MNIFDYYYTFQFISVPIFLHLYKKYIRNFFLQSDKNNSFKNKKSFSKKDYVDCYKSKLDKLYLEYRTNSSNSSNFYSNDFKHLTNTFIIDYTPKGNVIMKYDYDNNSIDYFCDCAISNDIIRTVFQKFTIINHCFPLYFGHIEEKDKIKDSIPTNNIIKKNLISSKIIEAQKSNVFVKLKQKSKLQQVLHNNNNNNNNNNNQDDKERIKLIESKLPGFCTIRNSGKFYNANIFKKYDHNFQNTNNIDKSGKNISFYDFKNNKIF
jgi:hypothetical protein